MDPMASKNKILGLDLNLKLLDVLDTQAEGCRFCGFPVDLLDKWLLPDWEKAYVTETTTIEVKLQTDKPAYIHLFAVSNAEFLSCLETGRTPTVRNNAVQLHAQLYKRNGKFIPVGRRLLYWRLTQLSSTQAFLFHSGLGSELQRSHPSGLTLLNAYSSSRIRLPHV
jgi:hypothetical protein